MFSAVVGHSEEVDARSAAQEIIDQCRARLDGTAPSAGLLFAAIDFDHEVLLSEIDRAFPGMALIGCTTDGELSFELGFREDSVTLLLFASDSVDIVAGVGRMLSADVAGACHAAVEAAKAKTSRPPRLSIATPEGLTAEGHSVTATLQHTVGDGIPSLAPCGRPVETQEHQGGLSGRGRRIARTPLRRSGEELLRTTAGALHSRAIST
jgi:hypothetical protein